MAKTTKEPPKNGRYSYTEFQDIAFDKFNELKKQHPDCSTPHLILMTATELKGLTWTRHNAAVSATFELRQMIERKLGRKPGVGLISAWRN